MERYTELNKINETGNSIIYKAKDNSIGRDVVIKKIRNPNKEYKIRLEREIKILSKLEHPNIVPIYDTYEDLDGTLCYVMRYIEGKTLLDSIEDFDKNQRMRVFSQILNVLDFVHKNNIIHRDLKPGNILIDSNHNLYLIDFGIAKDLDADYTRITRTGQYIGSQSYSSPEQEKGEKLTQKSDLYSLGLIFYEMIYGKTFIRDNLDKKKKDPLLRIIFKMTEKKLEDRYSNCEEIQKDLMNLRGEGKLKKFFSFLGYFLIGIFIIIFILIGIFYFFYYRSLSSSKKSVEITTKSTQRLESPFHKTNTNTHKEEVDTDRERESENTRMIKKDVSNLSKENFQENRKPNLSDLLKEEIKKGEDSKSEQKSKTYITLRSVNLRKESSTDSQIFDILEGGIEINLIQTNKSEYFSGNGRLYYWFFSPVHNGYIYGKYVVEKD